jgi:hypothetical protein
MDNQLAYAKAFPDEINSSRKESILGGLHHEYHLKPAA